MPSETQTSEPTFLGNAELEPGSVFNEICVFSFYAETESLGSQGPVTRDFGNLRLGIWTPTL